MTPRERHKRLRAYARASKVLSDMWRFRYQRGGILYVDEGPGAAVMTVLREHEAHAWSRLPDSARAAIRDPREP